MIYLMLLVAVIGCMLLCDARGKLFIFSRPLPALLCLVAGTGFFVLWDVLAIQRGIFLHRESEWMTGLMVGNQFPLEEVFFLMFLCYSSAITVTGWRVAAAWVRGRRQGERSGHVS